MNHTTFSKIIEMPNLIFERLEWKDDDFNNLEEHLSVCTNKFREEISHNLFGLSLLEKNDLIKNYFFSISEIYHNYLSFIFEEEEVGILVKVVDEEGEEEELEIVETVEDKIKLVKIFKEIFQEIIDIICIECIRYNIDALSIVDENLLSNSILNLEVFYEAKKNSLLDSSMGETNLKKSFTSKQAFDFFNHLNKEFYKDKSDLTKYSCIYVKMQADKFIDNDIKPEHFRQLLGKPPYRIIFPHPLKSLHAIPKRARKEYEEKKLLFFSLEKL
jgi:hypothetical protein